MDSYENKNKHVVNEKVHHTTVHELRLSVVQEIVIDPKTILCTDALTIISIC